MSGSADPPRAVAESSLYLFRTGPGSWCSISLARSERVALGGDQINQVDERADGIRRNPR